MKSVARLILIMLLLGVLLVACGGDEESEGEPQAEAPEVEATAISESEDTGPGMGPGMGPGGGMMERHSATVPEAYAGLTNPVAASEESLEAGGEIYTTYCATCHGDGGMGDGPAGQGLDPAPAAIAHTSQMLGDDYLFWRISEGGAMDPFNSAMPAWKGPLTEEERWHVINYVQALGSGEVMPGRMMGGEMYDPEAEAAQRAEMLAEAVETEVITQEEADVFVDVHAAMDELMAEGVSRAAGGMAEMQQALMNQLVNDGALTEEQVEIFNDVHDRLLEAGLMQ